MAGRGCIERAQLSKPPKDCQAAFGLGAINGLLFSLEIGEAADLIGMHYASDFQKGVDIFSLVALRFVVSGRAARSDPAAGRDVHVTPGKSAVARRLRGDS